MIGFYPLSSEPWRDFAAWVSMRFFLGMGLQVQGSRDQGFKRVI